MELRERHGQLSALHQYAEEAQRGRGRLVLVSGEAGVGKSALVETFADQLDEDSRVLWGACDGQFTPRPLGPLTDIAEQTGGDLARLVTTGAERELLFSAAREELTGGRAGDPLTVVVVEDAHWADEATLDLLRFLGRRLRGAHCLLVVTYRAEGMTGTDPLLIALGDLSSQRGTRRIVVPPLTRAALDDLADGGPVSGEELHRLTGGNPFFVGEVLRGIPGEVPPSARDAVLARLARLPEAARAYAEAAALMGSRVEPALLVDVVAGDPAGLDALVESGLLIGDGPALRFQHELARAAVDQATAAHRRAPLHGRILGSLVASQDRDVARLAYHAEGAEDAEAVLRYAPEAARSAAHLRSHREAALQYERALRFAAGEPGPTRARLYDALAWELALVDRWEQAAEQAEHALALWQTVDDPASRSGTQLFLARVMWRLNRGRESQDFTRQGWSTAAQLGDSPALARANADLAYDHLNNGRPADAIELLHEAERLAEELDLPDVLSDALNTEACALALAEDPSWLPMLRRSVQVARDHQLQNQAGRGYANLHAMLVLERRYAEATHWFREGIAYCEEHDIATYGTCLLSSQAEVELGIGEWDKAESISRQILDKPFLSPANAIPARQTLGTIHGRRGEPEAMGLLDEAVASVLTTGEPGWIVGTLPSRAELHWLLGDETAALDDVRRAAEVADTLDGWHRGEVATWLQRLGQPVDEDINALPEPHRLALGGAHEAAALAWDRLLCPWEAALARYDAGTESSLREALEGFHDLGAEAAARRCRRRLRELGVRSVPSGARAATRDHPAGLTPRESEVLDLLVEGLRNDEIAARLVISVKTVDHHVSAVLGKLGVGSRAAAATEARRLGLTALAT